MSRHERKALTPSMRHPAYCRCKECFKPVQRTVDCSQRQAAEEEVRILLRALQEGREQLSNVLDAAQNQRKYGGMSDETISPELWCRYAELRGVISGVENLIRQILRRATLQSGHRDAPEDEEHRAEYAGPDPWTDDDIPF